MGVTHVAVQFPLYEAFKSWAGKSFQAHIQLDTLLTNRSRWKPILPIPIHHSDMFSSLQNDSITSDLSSRSPTYSITNRKSLLTFFHHIGTERDKTLILSVEYWIKPPAPGENISPSYTDCKLVGCSTSERWYCRYCYQNQEAGWMERVL